MRALSCFAGSASGLWNNLINPVEQAVLWSAGIGFASATWIGQLTGKEVTWDSVEMYPAYSVFVVNILGQITHNYKTRSKTNDDELHTLIPSQPAQPHSLFAKGFGLFQAGVDGFSRIIVPGMLAGILSSWDTLPYETQVIIYGSFFGAGVLNMIPTIIDKCHDLDILGNKNYTPLAIS